MESDDIEYNCTQPAIGRDIWKDVQHPNDKQEPANLLLVREHVGEVVIEAAKSVEQQTYYQGEHNCAIEKNI